jgi:site-specific DNA recombinase
MNNRGDMNTTRYVLYARKSSESEDKQMQSIKAQVEALEILAAKNQWDIVEILCESKSAKAPFVRPEFDKMMKMFDEGQADGVLCWQLNRLSRNPTESGVLQQKLQDEVIKVIQTSDRVFMPQDNAVILSVETSVSNQFIIDLRKNVKRGIAQKAKDGGISGPAPEGYLNERVEKTVIKDPLRFPLIRGAFDMFLSGWSVQQIRRTLNDDKGYRTVKRKRRGDSPLSQSALYYILSNPRYAGKIPDPYEEGVMRDANFPSMITDEEYNQVQQLLGNKGRPRLVESRYFALKGLVKCGECGCSITAEKKDKILASGETQTYTYYHCTRKRPCSQRKNIREEALFKQVEELLSQYEISPLLYEWGMEAIGEIAKQHTVKMGNTHKMQESSIESVKSQLDRLVDIATKGFITAEDFGERSAPLKNELKRLQDQQQNQAKATRDWYEIVSKTIEVLNGANAKFVEGDILDKKQVLLAIGQNPLLRDGRLELSAYEWLVPIKNTAHEISEGLEKVRNESQQIKNDANEAAFTQWYPGLESNQRPKA